MFLIEDACHALGTSVDGKQLGTVGDIGCFSFYGNKIMTTGEGGGDGSGKILNMSNAPSLAVSRDD